MRTPTVAVVAGLAVLLSAAPIAPIQHARAESAVIFTDRIGSGLEGWPRVAANGGRAYVTPDAGYGAPAGLRLVATSASGSVAYVRRILPTSYRDLTIVVTERVRKEGPQGQTVALLRVFTASGTRILSVERRNGPAGRLIAIYGGATHETSTRLGLTTWARIAVRASINGRSGVIVVTLNGQTAFSSTNANLGTGLPGMIQLGNERAGQAYALDADQVTMTTPLKIVSFGPTVTASRLLASIADNTIDVIELAGGMYTPGPVTINVARTRPLLIRPAKGATVVFAKGSTTAFAFGFAGGVAGNITMQGFIFDDYHIGATGIIWIGNAHDITLNSMTVRNSTGLGGTSWALYLSTDNGTGPSNIVANDWLVDGGGRTLGALQSYHNPNARGVTALRWKVSNCAYTIYAHSDATGLDIEDWTADSCGLTTYAFLSVILQDVGGIIKNVHSTNSGAAAIGAPMVDGGGNTWD
jgi:hypothetical protein